MSGEEGNADYQACKEEFNLVQEYLLSEMVQNHKAGAHSITQTIRRAIHPPILQAWFQERQERRARQGLPACRFPPALTAPAEPLWSQLPREDQIVLLDDLDDILMVGYPYEGLEEILAQLTPESHLLLYPSNLPGTAGRIKLRGWLLRVEDFQKERRARLAFPPKRFGPREWKKLQMSRQTHISLLQDLEECVEEFSKTGQPSTRMREILGTLEYDRRPMLLAYKRFLKEERARAASREDTWYDSGDQGEPPPKADPLSAPPKQPPPPQQPDTLPTPPEQPPAPISTKEQIYLLNALEACLENYNRTGYPSEMLEEIIRQLTPRRIHSPEGIRDFIREQRERLAAASAPAPATFTSASAPASKSDSDSDPESAPDSPDLPPAPAPAPAPATPAPDVSMEMLNYLEACLERGHLIEEMGEAITGLTSKRVRGPEAIRKFIEEQRARHSPSSDCSGSDHNNRTAVTSPTAPPTHAPTTATTSESDLDSDPESAPVPTPDLPSAPASSPAPAAPTPDEEYHRELLAELWRERSGYCRRFFRDGHRCDRLDYVLEDLGIDTSLSAQATAEAVNDLLERYDINSDSDNDSDSDCDSVGTILSELGDYYNDWKCAVVGDILPGDPSEE